MAHQTAWDGPGIAIAFRRSSSGSKPPRHGISDLDCNLRLLVCRRTRVSEIRRIEEQPEGSEVNRIAAVGANGPSQIRGAEWLWIDTSLNHHRNAHQIDQDYVRTANVAKCDGTKVLYIGSKLPRFYRTKSSAGQVGGPLCRRHGKRTMRETEVLIASRHRCA